MFAYACRRFLSAIGMILVVGTIIFSLLMLVPGDPAELLLTTGGGQASAETVAALRDQMGLNEPVLSQYLSFLKGLATLDFGTSLTDGSLIADNVALRLPRTLELIFAATGLALLIGLPAGTYAALRPRGSFDRFASAISVFLASVPVFVVGTLFIYIFAQLLGVLPAGGYASLAADPVQHFKLLLLPAVAVSFNLITMVFRMTRASVLEMRSNDWIRTANAKGLTPFRVVRRHILRNAVGPVMTVVGLQMGILLGSTVLVEYVFNWPGLSGLLVTAVEQRDYPTVRGVILTVAVVFIFINLGLELVYSFLDPRVRFK